MVLEADISVKQLRHINKHLTAKNGNPGRTSCCQGRNGEHLVVKVQVYINNKGYKNRVVSFLIVSTSFF